MYVGLKQPRRDGERYVTPARTAAKETIKEQDRSGLVENTVPFDIRRFSEIQTLVE